MSRPCKTPGHTRGHVHVRRPVFTSSSSDRDAQSGSCAAVVKDQTEEFGKWKSHACRYERPYMCKRPLNSKPDAPFLPWFPVLPKPVLEGAPPCSQRSSLPTCSHLSSRLVELLRQLLLAGQQRQPVDHLARGPHPVLRHGGSPSDRQQVGRNQLTWTRVTCESHESSHLQATKSGLTGTR